MPDFADYPSAAKYQLLEWAAGRPWHNPWSPGATAPGFKSSDGECCPDFSCCSPELLASREARVTFLASIGILT
jgi:hypothetical protein